MDVSGAFALIPGLDPQFLQIVGFSLPVTIASVLPATLIVCPQGMARAATRIPGRCAQRFVANATLPEA